MILNADIDTFVKQINQQNMSVINTIQNRRSCRNYTEQTVEQEKIEILTKAALWSPTSKNNRPWEFIWVTEKETLSALSTCKPHGADFIGKCPLALVIIANPLKSDVWVEDTSIAATMVQLAAENIGLGSCWVQVRLRAHGSGVPSSDYCKRVLSIPDEYEVASIITLGYKAKERCPYTDEQLMTEKIHTNLFC